MGLQAAAIASQIDLNNSQAEKNRADAKKTAGAQGMGAGIASGHEMGIKQQGRGMGLQAAAIASQIDLNNSQAEKNRAKRS